MPDRSDETLEDPTMKPPFGTRTARLAALALMSAAIPSAISAAPEIRVLSNRPDLVSAGDVLIEIVLPDPPPAAVVLLRNGAPAVETHGTDADGRYLVRVTGLELGANVLTARFYGDRK